MHGPASLTAVRLEMEVASERDWPDCFHQCTAIAYGSDVLCGASRRIDIAGLGESLVQPSASFAALPKTPSRESLCKDLSGLSH